MDSQTEIYFNQASIKQTLVTGTSLWKRSLIIKLMPRILMVYSKRVQRNQQIRQMVSFSSLFDEMKKSY